MPQSNLSVMVWDLLLKPQPVTAQTQEAEAKEYAGV